MSPDDKRIAVSIFDWSTKPMKMRIYVEDLQAGGHNLEIFSSTNLYGVAGRLARWEAGAGGRAGVR